MTTLREEIRPIISNRYHEHSDNKVLDVMIDDIIKLIEKRIDKVEQDYKSKLTNWGKQQPMTEMYPKQMDALNKVRKQIE